MIPIISEDQINEIWTPSENIQAEKVGKYIKLAQELRIAEIWGDALYDQIQLELGGATVTVENQLLIDKSLNVVAHWATFYGIKPTSNNMYNKGNLNPSANYGNPTDKVDTTNQEQRAYLIAGQYTEKLLKFLTDNQTDYPLWVGCDTSQGSNITAPGFMFPTRQTDKAGRISRRTKNNI